MPTLPRIILSTGEPAGIGPDLAVTIAQQAWPCQLIVAGDRDLLATRAQQLQLSLQIQNYDTALAQPQRAGAMTVLHIATHAPVQAGSLNVANARYVLQMLDRACDGC